MCLCPAFASLAEVPPPGLLTTFWALIDRKSVPWPERRMLWFLFVWACFGKLSLGISAWL